MAPNGTASRKTPAPPKSALKSEDGIPLENLFDDEDLEVKIGSALLDDARKRLPQLKNPGNWNSDVVGGAKAKEAYAKPTPSINKIHLHIAKAFPNGKPMADRPDVLKCNHCKRAVSKHSMPKHIENCLNRKQEKQRKKKEAKDARDAAARKERAGDSDEEEEESAKKSATKTGLTASKKRKAVDEGDDAAPSKKKKKKDDPKAKAARPKAPVDVEKQCGVELPQGGQCARSLTCKSHSMGAKRAVPGRSAPYDKLLMEYQRKNQARQQKAAFDATAPNPDDDNLPTGPVDSEEEKEAVISAIARSWGGAPIFQPTHVPLRKKYEYNRLKGIMQSAFGSRGSIFGTGVAANYAVPSVESDGMTHVRRASVQPGARSIMPTATRKASVVSGA